MSFLEEKKSESTLGYLSKKKKSTTQTKGGGKKEIPLAIALLFFENEILSLSLDFWGGATLHEQRTLAPPSSAHAGALVVAVKMQPPGEGVVGARQSRRCVDITS